MSVTTSHPDVAAIVVLYNPRQGAIEAQLRALAASSVANVVMVDNSSNRHASDVEAFRPDFGDLRYVALGTNLGIAAAQNRGAAEFVDRVDYLLFLDQDSVPEPRMVSLLVEEAEELVRLGVDLAAIGPTPICRGTGRPYRGRLPRRTRILPNHRSIEKSEIISSGSLVPSRAFRQVGGLDEKLFIDGVDHEWCWRARAHHNKVIAMSRAARLVHMVGEGDRLLLGVRVKIPAPMRTYYQYRNYFYLVQRRYVPLYWKVANAIKYLIKYPYFSLMGRNGAAFRTAMNRGIRDGVRSLAICSRREDD